MELQQPQFTAAATEIERWIREPCISTESTPEIQKAYMQSKAYDFPIITQMARDYHSIPPMSAPSERVFSVAGNLIPTSENVWYVCIMLEALGNIR
jgi:hypothetical protein